MTKKTTATRSNSGVAADGSRKTKEHTKPAQHSTPELKWKRVLRALRSGRSLNRFEAERELHDHCLNSTISGLYARGLNFVSLWETVPALGGAATVRVKRYALCASSALLADKYLGKEAW